MYTVANIEQSEGQDRGLDRLLGIRAGRLVVPACPWELADLARASTYIMNWFYTTCSYQQIVYKPIHLW